MIENSGPSEDVRLILRAAQMISSDSWHLLVWSAAAVGPTSVVWWHSNRLVRQSARIVGEARELCRKARHLSGVSAVLLRNHALLLDHKRRDAACPGVMAGPRPQC